MMLSKLLIAAIGFTALTSSAAAGLGDAASCYKRTYSAKHLANQPNQNIKTLTLSIESADSTQSLTLAGTNRSGQFGYMKFVCYNSPKSGCGTFESDSQLWVAPQVDNSIIIKTRNTYLSDVGGEYDHLEKDFEKHHMFYLEEGKHSYTIGSGPFYHFRLYPTALGDCPKIK